MGIREIFEKIKARKERAEEIEFEEKVQTRMQNKKLSADERELNSYMEEDRKREMKRVLAMYRKRKQDQFWHGYNPIHQKNTITNDDRPILKIPNLFSSSSNNRKVFKKKRSGR